VDIHYSTTFENLVDDGDAVEVTYVDGTTERVDFVVGADGVRSQVRGYVLDADLQPRYIGQSAFRVNIPREPEIDRIILQEGPHGMAGFVPIGPDLAYLFYNAQMERSDRPADEDLADVLKEHLTPFGGLTGRVRDKYINVPTAVVLRPEESLIAEGPWRKGWIVLADCLTKHDDLEAVFLEYTDRRLCSTATSSSVTRTGSLSFRPVSPRRSSTLRSHKKTKTRGSPNAWRKVTRSKGCSR
jgi:hypothetical protein